MNVVILFVCVVRRRFIDGTLFVYKLHVNEGRTDARAHTHTDKRRIFIDTLCCESTKCTMPSYTMLSVPCAMSRAQTHTKNNPNNKLTQRKFPNGRWLHGIILLFLFAFVCNFVSMNLNRISERYIFCSFGVAFL